MTQRKKRLSTHKPKRCKDCKWIDEADSEKGTSFMGVEFCSLHNKVINSYDKSINAYLRALLIAKLRLIRLEGLLPGETTKEIEVIDKVFKMHKK